MKKRRLLAGLMSLAVVASLGSCEWKYDQNSDVSSDIVSTGNTDPSSAIYDGNDATHYGETHIVTYNLNGGTMPSGKSVSETVTWGDYLDLPVPTKAGYVFVGWFYESSDVNDPTRQWTNSDAVYKDITLTAHWKKIPVYIITLNAKGGTCSTTFVQTNQDGTYSLPPYENVTRDGYVFKGWYNGTEKWDYSGIYSITSNITLVADWETVNHYTITLNLNGGIYNASTDNCTFNFDNTKKYNGGEQLPVPTKSGFTFVGYGIGARLVTDDNAVLTVYGYCYIYGTTLKAFYKADDGTLNGDVYEFGNYPKTAVSNKSSLYSSLATATDTDNDG